MSSLKAKFIPLFFLLSLAGCAGQTPREPALAWSKAELLKCMGEPQSREQSGADEVLVYTGSKPDYACPLKVWARGEPPLRQCKVLFTLRDERVRRVDYRDNSGGVLTTPDKCAFLLDRCR